MEIIPGSFLSDRKIERMVKESCIHQTERFLQNGDETFQSISDYMHTTTIKLEVKKQNKAVHCWLDKQHIVHDSIYMLCIWLVFSWTTLPLDMPLVRYYSATKQVVTRPVKVHHFRCAGQTQHPKEMTDLHTSTNTSCTFCWGKRK